MHGGVLEAKLCGENCRVGLMPRFSQTGLGFWALGFGVLGFWFGGLGSRV